MLLAVAIIAGLLAHPSQAWAGDDPSYIVIYTNRVELIQWTSSQGQVIGSVQEVYTPPGEPYNIETVNASFRGIQQGNQISITFPVLGNFSGETWTGQAAWGTLKLAVPLSNGQEQVVRFNSGTVEQYNGLAAEFRNHIASAAAHHRAALGEQRRLASQQQAVVNANSDLLDDLSRLRRDIVILKKGPDFSSNYAAFETDLEAMRQSNAKEQNLATQSPLTCYRLGEVKYAAGEVKYHRGEVTYQDGAFKYQLDQWNQDISIVQDRIAKTQAAERELDQAIASDSTGYPSRAVSQSQVQSLIAQTRAAIQKATLAREAALKKAGGYDQVADKLNAQAQEFVTTLQCSDSQQ